MKRERRERGEGSWTGHEGEWRLQISAGVDPATGKRRRPSFVDRTKTRARAQAAKYLAEIREDRVPPARQTVARYLERWLAQKTPYLRPNTVHDYTWHITRNIGPALGAKRLGELDRHDVERMLVAIRARGLSVKSANSARRVLATALRDNELGVVNVALLARPLPAVKHEVRPMTVDEVERLLVATAGTRRHGVYVVALSAGPRQGELLGEQWGDVDLDAPTMRVRHTLQYRGKTYHLEPPKTEKSRRTLPLAPAAVDALRNERSLQLFERKKAGDAWQKEWDELGFDLVFRTEHGRPLNGTWLTHAFQRDLKTAKIETAYRFHDLRHTFATFLLARHVDIAIISRLLGHASIATTADIYAHVLDDVLVEAVGQLGDVLAAANGKSVGKEVEPQASP